MNNRQIIIIAALALPVIGLVALSRFNPQEPPTAKRAVAPAPVAVNRPAGKAVTHWTNLDEGRLAVANRMKQANTLSPQQYAAMQKKYPQLPPTVEAYRALLKTRMDQLAKMTPAQWDSEQKTRLAAIMKNAADKRAVTPVPVNAVKPAAPVAQPAPTVTQ